MFAIFGGNRSQKMMMHWQDSDLVQHIAATSPAPYLCGLIVMCALHRECNKLSIDVLVGLDCMSRWRGGSRAADRS